MVKICPTCKNFVPVSAKSCPLCGNTKLVSANTPSTPQIPPKVTPTPSKKKKSKAPLVVALFVAVTIAIAAIIHFGLPIESSGIETPQKCNSDNHLWIYNVNAKIKDCSVCGEQQSYSPSGYYLNAIQIEIDSFKPFFNDTHILCAYSESTFEKFNSSKSESVVKSLIEENKAFYVKANVILSDTDMAAPQRHITVTSGEYNGTDCWTAMAVVVDDGDVEFYRQWLNDPSNPVNRDSSQEPSNTPSSVPSDNSKNQDFVGILEGTYLVGTDIPAGTYRLVPLFSEYPGYWKRCSNASGEAGSIIANDLFESTTYVTVNAGEYLEIKRCSGALQ